VDDEVALGTRRSLRGALPRRLALAVGVAVAGGALGLHRASSRRASARAGELAALAERALVEGLLGVARAAVDEARKLDPESEAARIAHVHTTSASLIEGDAPAVQGIALLDEVRAWGMRGPLLGQALLASAVRGNNDRLAVRLLVQHGEQGIRGDPSYELVAGAALELACDDGAAERFESVLRSTPASVLARLRLAWAQLMASRLDEAATVAAALPPDRAERAILLEVVARLRRYEGAADAPAPRHVVDPFGLTDLPRSIRPLAQALTVHEANAGTGIEAALDDLDTPLAALLVARLAVVAGDAESAQLAIDAGVRMRAELAVPEELAHRIVRLRQPTPAPSPVASSSALPATPTAHPSASAPESVFRSSAAPSNSGDPVRGAP
jgi:hypothetical protein